MCIRDRPVFAPSGDAGDDPGVEFVFGAKHGKPVLAPVETLSLIHISEPTRPY